LLARLANLAGLATIAPGKTGTGMSKDHWLRKIDILIGAFLRR
jgi:hypothetical protein